MITLKNILDLCQYTEEDIILVDKNDNQLIEVRLFCDIEFMKYYKYEVNAIEANEQGLIKITINI